MPIIPFGSALCFADWSLIAAPIQLVLCGDRNYSREMEIILRVGWFQRCIFIDTSLSVNISSGLNRHHELKHDWFREDVILGIIWIAANYTKREITEAA
jgi:hypothetical protein